MLGSEFYAELMRPKTGIF